LKILAESDCAGRGSLANLERSLPVVGEFRKRPEFYGLLSLIPSCGCATFSLFFYVRLLSSSGWFNPVDFVPLLPSPS
jgi:hypothetical protein